MQKFMCYCTNFALFYFEFEGNLRVQVPGACVWKGDLSQGFLCYEFGGLIFGGAYFRNFTVFQKNKQGHDDTKPNKTHSVHLENIHYTR